MINGLVSLILFILEFIMLIVISWKNNHKRFYPTIAVLLALLQLYQLSEFLICIGVKENIVGRIAFVVISFLPPFGYFLATQITEWQTKDYYIGFALGTFFSVYYAIIPKSVEIIDCNVFYAVYNYPLKSAYGYYYFGLIFYSIGFLAYHLIKKQLYEDKLRILLLIGYLVFLIPMQIMIIVDTFYRTVIPSIMCKYAFLLAITLTIMSFLDKNSSKKDVAEEKR